MASRIGTLVDDRADAASLRLMYERGGQEFPIEGDLIARAVVRESRPVSGCVLPFPVRVVMVCEATCPACGFRVRSRQDLRGQGFSCPECREQLVDVNGGVQ